MSETTAGSRLSRLRGALKAFVYSGPGRDRWQQPDRVLDALELGEGQKVADVGAGGGYFTYRLARAVGPHGRVYAVDPDADMRLRISERVARKGYSNIVTVDPGDDVRLPEPVDLVVIVDAFHHLPQDRTAYFARLAEALRPGGRVAIIEPWPRWFLFGHATEPERIRSVLAGGGYALAAEHDFLVRQSFTVYARPT
ncbi:MAG: SAM-dependent methyltransferase [Nitriliruptorales bacterium]